MDTTEDVKDPDEYQGRLRINFEIQDHLYQAAKWAKLLSFIGFFIILLIVAFALSINAIFLWVGSIIPDMPELPTQGITVFYLVIAGIYLIPTISLYRFSSNIRRSFTDQDQLKFAAGFSSLTSFFKFWGIFTLIIILLFAAITGLTVAGGINAVENMKNLHLGK